MRVLFVAALACALVQCKTREFRADSEVKATASNAKAELDLPSLIKAVNDDIKSIYSYDNFKVSDDDISNHKVKKVEHNSNGKILSAEMTTKARVHANHSYKKTLHECYSTATFNSSGAIAEMQTECESIEE